MSLAMTPAPHPVHLVGAGPGDPELLTLKALRVLREASVILVDDLVGEQVLAAALEGVAAAPRVVRVGKRGGCASTPQEFIEKLMVREALAGERVVRLKGGDPLVFGRGGEEIEALVAAGIAVEVVPGITAALGCAASVGIPLTHRDHAQACVFVTGHTREGVAALDWQMLSRPRQTVVIYMGIEALPTIARQLMQHGLPAATPAALIANGTTDRERRVIGTLATIGRQAMRAELDGPTLRILGEVVALGSTSEREFPIESRIGL